MFDVNLLNWKDPFQEVVMTVRAIFLALAFIASACQSPTSPTGFDPSKPVDANNMPPGPGPSVRASVQSWSIYVGNCPEDPASCEKQIHPTNDPNQQMPPPPWRHDHHVTYMVERLKTYTMWFCVNHPKVPGRRLWVKVAGPAGELYGHVYSQVMDEGTVESPFCVAVPFPTSHNGMHVGELGGGFQFREDNQDLLEPTEVRISVGFRGVAPGSAGH